MKYGKLYLDFLGHCRPFSIARPWSQFVDGSDVMCAPLYDEPMLAALREKHSRHALIRSGVAVRAPSKQLQINPIFLGMPNPILPLRKTPQGAAFDLITDQGSASGRLPLRAAVHDHQVSGGIGQSGFLFTAFSLQDLVSLRTIGLPVAFAGGLADFNQHSLDDFRSAFGFSQSKPPKVPHQLILVGWSPSKLSRQLPGMFDRTVCNLMDSEKVLGLSLQNILAWQPDAAGIDGIVKCLRIGTESDVVREILTSLDESCQPLVPEPTLSSPSAGLLVSEQRLQEALLRPEVSRVARRRRLRDFRRAVDEAFVMPLLERAADEQNLSERSRFGGLAKLSGILHLAVAVKKANLEREIVERGLRGDAVAFDIQGLMKGFDALYKLSRESD